VKGGLRGRIRDPLQRLLQQGVSAERLALCVAIGVVVGTIPVLGTSTLLCAAIALLFRLNLPAMQVVQAAMAPAQLLLIIPFVRLGEWLLRAPRQPASLEAVLAPIAQGGARAVVLWDAAMDAAFAWMLVAPAATFLIYKMLAPAFDRAARRITGGARPQDL
jgi:uncharacterized protein (DUF2062 family)